MEKQTGKIILFWSSFHWCFVPRVRKCSFRLSPSKGGPCDNLVSSCVFSSNKSYTSRCVLDDDPQTVCNDKFIALYTVIVNI